MTGSELNQIIIKFEKHSNPEQAVKMAAYMRNQFEFYGIQTPMRRQLGKERIKTLELKDWNQVMNIAKALRNHPKRECQYAAIELLIRTQKLRTIQSITFFERLITNKSWRDTVDGIDSDLVGKYLLLHPENKKDLIVGRSQSDNIWLQRVALQFQLPLKFKTDTALLEKVIDNTKDSTEFFVQKGMGWILREYSKTNPDRVRHIIKTKNLSKLTVREGSKYI